MSIKLVGKTKLKIKRFDPFSSFADPFNMVLIGHKHTGKSTLIKDFMFHLFKLKYPRVVVFSGTEESNHFFSSFVPPEYVYYGADIDIITNIISNQRDIVKSVSEAEEKLGSSCNVDVRLLIVLDDVMFNKTLLNHEVFRYIFFNGRHNKISIILSTQYLMWIPSEYRANIDHLVVLRENIPKNRIKLYESFMGCFESKQVFFSALDQLTNNFECMVLDTTQTELTPETMIKWYKAALTLPPFKFLKFK